MAKYIIVNRSKTKHDGVIRQNTTYFSGVLKAGGFCFQNWGRGKKNAYIFESKADANRYFKQHRLGEHNELGWVKTGWNWFSKSNYEIVKIS